MDANFDAHSQDSKNVECKSSSIEQELLLDAASFTKQLEQGMIYRLMLLQPALMQVRIIQSDEKQLGVRDDVYNACVELYNSPLQPPNSRDLDHTCQYAPK